MPILADLPTDGRFNMSLALSMYEACVPQFTRGLENLAQILSRANSHATAQRFDSSVLCATRLYPDMYPLSNQVQRATQVAAGCAVRLAGGDLIRAVGDERSLADLTANVRRTIVALTELNEARFVDSADRRIVLSDQHGTYEMSGRVYLLQLALPNFYFHVTTAYDICRHCGVKLLKRDYIGFIS